MIVALIGEDLFRKEQEIEKFLTDALGAKKEDPLARKILYATDTTIPSVADSVIESCDTVSLFADNQVVVVRRAENLKAADSKTLADWLKTKPDCNLLLEFSKLLKTAELFKALKTCKATISEFHVPKPWELEKWIEDTCKTVFQKDIEAAAKRYLADALGTDTANIVSELEKVLQFDPDISVFTEKLVKEFIVPQREIKAFEIRDSFGDKNAKAYVQKLHEMMEIQKVEGVQIVAVLFDYVVQLLHTSTMLDSGETPEAIAEKLGINSFIFCKKNNEPRRAKLFGTPVLCRLLKRLADLDYLFKNGKCTSKTSQELLLASLIIPPR